jgi:nitrate reductase gamma subunit
MEGWILFGRGPLFRLGLVLMVLGLLRILWLTFVSIWEVLREAQDGSLPKKEILRQTVAWMFPIGRLWRRRPVYSSLSFLFHVGLIVVPIFLAAHILLWRENTGIPWPTIPQRLANWLTLMVIATALGIFLGRLLHSGARQISGFQDYLWPLLLAVPFATGYVASNMRISPSHYESMMLLHIYAGDLILMMVPFTKIAHCVLTPLSQLVSQVAWKFSPGAGDRVAETLGYGDRPSWVAKSRLSVPALPNGPSEGVRK